MDPPQFVFNEEEMSSQQQPMFNIPIQMQLFNHSQQSQSSQPSHPLQYDTPEIYLPTPTQAYHKQRKYSSITNQADASAHQMQWKSQNSELLIQIQPRQRKKSSTYQQKVDLFHLQKASQMKRNFLASEQNQSPTIQKEAHYSLRPHHQGLYEPHNQDERTLQLKQVKGKQGQIVENKFVQSHDSVNNILALESFQQIIPHLTANRAFLPIPNNSQFQFIRENSSYHPTYTIQTNEGQALISARKRCFHFNSHFDIMVGNEVVGELKGNFGGSQFNLYRHDEGTKILIATIIYETFCSCTSSYRKIQLYYTPNDTHDLMFKKQSQRRNLKDLLYYSYDGITKLVTRQPTWNKQGQYYSLPFGGKAKLSSRKNMLLINETNPQANALLFCKTDINTFYLQVQTNINLLTIMGMLLSSFDFKLLSQ